MKIAVTGSYSYSGKYITRRLLARGEQVITLTGHPNRPDPFAGQVKAFPLDFDVPGMARSLTGVDTLYNTYWVRFDHGAATQSKAVENTARLIESARLAGVRRIVHISITNPSPESHLPYFRGKALNEQAVIASGLSYAILRPTVLFGAEDILINNIAYLLRRFPVFALPGDGSYRLQPIFVDDLAELALEAGTQSENLLWDAVGPDIFSFKELIQLIGACSGYSRPLISVPANLALAASRIISAFVGDVLLTQDEVDGLTAGLLVSAELPRATTRLANWLTANKESVGRQYASELKRHYL
ncbi:MAG: NAD(P)H-binding protein [Chloroflexi bacterium]|nr:NAD(P)H-binding protein [Chloroflexota bacterium]